MKDGHQYRTPDFLTLSMFSNIKELTGLQLPSAGWIDAGTANFVALLPQAFRGYTREAAIRPNRIPENAFIASVARLKCLWFSSGVGFGRLSNFPLEGEPAISGRIEPLKPTLGSNFVKELRVQESKTEIRLTTKPFCWVLSQLPLCYPNYAPGGRNASG